LKSVVFILSCILFFVASTSLFAQEKNQLTPQPTDTLKTKNSKINVLAPARAAFLSAILPGMGQAYNKSYWKIPIVYGAIGTGVYFYLRNDNLYNRYRDAYKTRIGGGIDEYRGQYSDATLINAQRTFERNRDISLIVTIGLYALNIVDANIEAHLQQFNVNEKLSFQPQIIQNSIDYSQNIGLILNYKF
jgi:hypothetical protein